MGRIGKHLRGNTSAEYGNREKTPKQPYSFGGASAWLSGITLWVTIMSITLYAAGKAYRANYLHQFGVMDNILPWPPQDLIFLGTVTQIKTLIWAYPFVAVVIFGTVAVLWGSYAIGRLLDERFSSARKSKHVSTHTKADASAPRTETAFLLLLIMVGLVLCAMFYACLSFIANAEELGKIDATKEREAMIREDLEKIGQSGFARAEMRRSVEGHPVVESGYVVSCSEKACLLFGKSSARGANAIEESTMSTMYVPLERASSFSFTPIEPKK